MKKNIFLICALVFLSSTVFSQSIDFGFGATAGTKMKIENTGTNTAFGVNARGVFNFANKFGISTGISFFLPNKFKLPSPAIGEYRYSHLVVNVDFLYYFLNIPKVKIYALGGVVNTNQLVKVIFMSTFEKLSNSEFGFEIGSGVKIGPVFGEIKYETKVNQFIGTIGFYIN